MTNAEFAILSLIAEKSRHGYEIEQVIEARNMRYWTEIGFSSIYYILNKLEKNKLIEGRTGQPEGRGPARKVYHITPPGKAAWKETSIEALSTPNYRDLSFLIGLGNLAELNMGQALPALHSNLATQIEMLAYLRDITESRQPSSFFLEAEFDYILSKIEAEINWLKKFIKQLEAHTKQD